MTIRKKKQEGLVRVVSLVTFGPLDQCIIVGEVVDEMITRRKSGRSKIRVMMRG